MAEKCKTVAINFGSIRAKKYLLFGQEEEHSTGSLWSFTYPTGSDVAQYSGATGAILGPDCRFTPFSPGCYAAPTGPNGPEGPSPWDHVTLSPGKDSYVYLDVGFWGGRRRDFGLVCGDNVWLCSFGRGGSAPEPDDFPSQFLVNFHRLAGNFDVVQYAKAKVGEYALSTSIYLLLPDMHMWPDPGELNRRRNEFFSKPELDELHASLAAGKLQKRPDGTIDVPEAPEEQNINPANRALNRGCRLWLAPGGRTAMKANQLGNLDKMKREEVQYAFGAAGSDLVQLLNTVQRARANSFDITVIQVGDLLEMWAPVETCIDDLPMDEGDGRGLQLTDVAKGRIPKWLSMIYGNRNNRSALDSLKNVGCEHIYGNHDVYLALDWKPSHLALMDGLMFSRAYLLYGKLWVEHGHRFQFSNSDGYWVSKYPTAPAGPRVTGLVNYYPGLRKLADTFDNPTKNLYSKNLPYATVWYLLAHHAQIHEDPGKSLFFRPPEFNIFCQGHTHSPVLLKVMASWQRVTGAPLYAPTQPAPSPQAGK